MASITRTAAAVAKEIQFRTAKMLLHKSFGVKVEKRDRLRSATVRST